MSCCSTQRLFAARGRPYRCCWSVKGQSKRQARIGYIAWWSVRPVSCAVSHWPSWRASLCWDPKTKQVGGPDERRSGFHDSSIAVRQTVQCHVCVPLWISDVTANSCLLPFNWMRGYLRTSLWKWSKAYQLNAIKSGHTYRTRPFSVKFFDFAERKKKRNKILKSSRDYSVVSKKKKRKRTHK